MINPPSTVLTLLCAILLTCSVTACTSGPDNTSTKTNTSPPPPVATTTPDDYRLVWSDEFNTDGPPDPANWSYEQGFVRNQELQWYQPENATCKNGLLIIEARRETNKPNPLYVPGSANWKTSRKNIEYTSACLTTKDKHTWQYGRFLMRGKINTHPGSWPAFWTLGSAGRWPAGGEIDIMEFYQNTLLANVAWGGTNGARWHTVKKPLTEFAPNWSDQFHIWRMDWTKDAINLYCDDQLLNQTPLSQTINATPTPATAPSTRPNRRSPETPEPGINPFTTRPVYILLNQAIGGQAGGDPSHTPFPLRLEVDYVRIYQQAHP